MFYEEGKYIYNKCKLLSKTVNTYKNSVIV